MTTPKEHPIKHWMTRTRTSQRALARQAGIDHSTISRHVAGKRSISVEGARALREVTGLSLDAILSTGGKASGRAGKGAGR